MTQRPSFKGTGSMEEMKDVSSVTFHTPRELHPPPPPCDMSTDLQTPTHPKNTHTHTCTPHKTHQDI